LNISLTFFLNFAMFFLNKVMWICCSFDTAQSNFSTFEPFSQWMVINFCNLDCYFLA